MAARNPGGEERTKEGLLVVQQVGQNDNIFKIHCVRNEMITQTNVFLYEIVVEEETLSLGDNKGIVGLEVISVTFGGFFTQLIYNRHFIASLRDREVSGLSLPQVHHHTDPGPPQDHEYEQ